MKRDTELSRQLRLIMTKARENLEVAKQLHRQNYFNITASRAYYAVFHVLQAVLLTKGLSFSKHSAVLSAFNKEFICSGVFTNDFYDRIRRLFKDRQIGDYDYERAVSRESSEADVADAEMIIDAIEKYLQREGYLYA